MRIARARGVRLPTHTFARAPLPHLPALLTLRCWFAFARTLVVSLVGLVVTLPRPVVTGVYHGLVGRCGLLRTHACFTHVCRPDYNAFTLIGWFDAVPTPFLPHVLPPHSPLPFGCTTTRLFVVVVGSPHAHRILPARTRCPTPATRTALYVPHTPRTFYAYTHTPFTRAAHTHPTPPRFYAAHYRVYHHLRHTVPLFRLLPHCTP